MNHLKLYEELNEIEPEVGDYIFAKWKHAEDEHPANIFVTNNIGEIIDIKENHNIKTYVIKYKNIPEDLDLYRSMLNNSCFRFKREDILKWSKNKEELETILQANKFNI